MALLIDCYNVLHAEKPPMLAGLEVAGLCRALARTRWARDPIVLVCDGSPSPLTVSASPVTEVELMFSGPNRTADQLIIDRINTHTAPRRLLVVSSDHEIRHAARRRAAAIQRSEAFLHTLVRELTRGRPTPAGSEKPDPSDMHTQQINQWLKDFGYKPDQTSESPTPPRSNDLDPENDPDIPWPPDDVERKK
jgi:predicted RNA-binding protein with PIN domain